MMLRQAILLSLLLLALQLVARGASIEKQRGGGEQEEEEGEVEHDGEHSDQYEEEEEDEDEDGDELDEEEEDPFPALTKVITKLEQMARQKEPSSGLQMADLEAAKSQWDEWPEDKQLEARQVPLVRIVIDFVLTPMELARHTIDLKNPDASRVFLERLEHYYKHFLPAYEGEQLGGGIGLKVGATFELYEKLSKRAEVGAKMFHEARKEVEVWRSKLEELTQWEDIYANVEELEFILNFFNMIPLKPFWTNVFPMMDSNPELSAQQLADIYHKALERNFNAKFRDDGTLVRYVAA